MIFGDSFKNDFFFIDYTHVNYIFKFYVETFSEKNMNYLKF